MPERKVADLFRDPQDGGAATFGQLAEQAEFFEELAIHLGGLCRRKIRGEFTQQADEGLQRHRVRVRPIAAAAVVELGHQPEADLAALDAKGVEPQRFGQGRLPACVFDDMAKAGLRVGKRTEPLLPVATTVGEGGGVGGIVRQRGKR